MVSKTGDSLPVADSRAVVRLLSVTLSPISWPNADFSVPQWLLEYPKVLEMYHTLEYLIQLELAMYGLVGWVKSR